MNAAPDSGPNEPRRGGINIDDFISINPSPPSPGLHGRHKKRDHAMTTIGLCMIVKNESKVITRCLGSVRPLVDYVMIEDTGSTDGTQQLITDWLERAAMKGM